MFRVTRIPLKQEVYIINKMSINKTGTEFSVLDDNVNEMKFTKNSLLSYWMKKIGIVVNWWNIAANMTNKKGLERECTLEVGLFFRMSNHNEWLIFNISAHALVKI